MELLTPSPGLLIWTLLAFLIVFFLLKKFAWPAIIKGLNDREANIAGSIATGFQSWDTLKEKIRTQILSLPEDTLICPGHGPLTTVAQEKQHNPFFS